MFLGTGSGSTTDVRGKIWTQAHYRKHNYFILAKVRQRLESGGSGRREEKERESMRYGSVVEHGSRGRTGGEKDLWIETKGGAVDWPSF